MTSIFITPGISGKKPVIEQPGVETFQRFFPQDPGKFCTLFSKVSELNVHLFAISQYFIEIVTAIYNPKLIKTNLFWAITAAAITTSLTRRLFTAGFWRLGTVQNL
jgi:hypothetical protein